MRATAMRSSLRQQYETVKDRTSAHGTYSLGSHVMEYGDVQGLATQNLNTFMGTYVKGPGC